MVITRNAPWHWRGIFCAACLALATPALAGIEGGERHKAHPPWMEPGLIDLETDLETIREQGKRGLMVLYTTVGCSYCAEFVKRSLNDPDLQQRLRDNFISVGLEIFDDAEMTGPDGADLSIKAFAKEQGAEMAPTLLFFGPDGQRTLRAVGYQTPERFGLILDYLIDGPSGISFRDYAEQRTKSRPRDPSPYPALQADPLFVPPPYALARQPIAADRPLLVLFERVGCAGCASLHANVLALPDVREILTQFEVVRLDADDDSTPVIAPDGRRTTPAKWFADAGFSDVPAFLYVDENGNTVLRNDAVAERQRLLNMSGLVLDKKYLDGWSYQRYARSKAIERNRSAQ
ncbi:MAG: thioredoxin fold domain-containing protein [Sedimenticolaceae bacterium]|jgi:thioredoxin-related protein